MSVTSRIAGSIGKHHSFWAMYSLRMSVWIVPPSFSGGDPLLLGGDDVEGEQDRRRRVDRHRDRDLVERDPVEERLHVVDACRRRRPRTPTSPSERAWSESSPIRVGMSKAVERPVWPCVEQVAEALVGLLDGAEAGELAHRPEPPAVHRRVDAAGERVLAGVAELLGSGSKPARSSCGVERLDRVPGDRLEQRLALRGAVVELLAPLVGAPPRLGLDRHRLRV